MASDSTISLTQLWTLVMWPSRSATVQPGHDGTAASGPAARAAAARAAESDRRAASQESLAIIFSWDQLRAMLANLVKCSTKARRTFAVGPLRCLATMISAVPFSFDSGL